MPNLIEKWLDTAKNFIKAQFEFKKSTPFWVRYGFIASLAILFIYFLQPTEELLHNVVLSAFLTLVGMSLISLGLFAITKIPFIKRMKDFNEDGKISAYEILSFAIISAAIIIGISNMFGNLWTMIQYNILK